MNKGERVHEVGGADAKLAPLLSFELVQVRVCRHSGDDSRREGGGDREAPPRLRRRQGARCIVAEGREVRGRLAGDAREAERVDTREGLGTSGGSGGERGAGRGSHGGRCERCGVGEEDEGEVGNGRLVARGRTRIPQRNRSDRAMDAGKRRDWIVIYFMDCDLIYRIS
jgi:hypothetical protein